MSQQPYDFGQAREAAASASRAQKAAENFIREAYKDFAIKEEASKGWLNRRLGRWVVYANGRQMYRYRWVMEQHLGRRLASDEHVHHINGDSIDDRLENLELISPSDHSVFHLPERQAARGARHGSDWVDGECCAVCSTREKPHYSLGKCKLCYDRDYRESVRRSARCAECGQEFRAYRKAKYCGHACSAMAARRTRQAI